MTPRKTKKKLNRRHATGASTTIECISIFSTIRHPLLRLNFVFEITMLRKTACIFGSI